MADEDMVFDSSLMKKKKKGIKKFDIDDALEAPAPVATARPTENTVTVDTGAPEEPTPTPASAPDVYNNDSLLDLESFGKKKKKKKAVAGTPSAAVEVVEPESRPREGSNSSGEDTGRNENEDGADDDLAAATEELSLDFGEKRKKKKKKKDIEDLVTVDLENNENENPDEGGGTGTSWLGSDRDYTYDELLLRVFDIMRMKNPEMASGTKQKFVMRPPQVVRIGTKKTSFVNFMEICKMLHRPQKHLLDFLLSELGTSGSIDGNNQLIIKGRFQQKQIENVLRRYIKEYVTCHTCRSPNTLLQKDSRIFFLQCEACGSRCSVVSIKHGFQAVTGKRAAIRAKAT